MASAGVQRAQTGARVEEFPPDVIIFGQSQAMRVLQQKIDKVAETSVPVLIQGENGTGKGVLAQYLHNHSACSDGPFIKVNCPAIPGTLLESELFGYEKGSFTGAHATKQGRVELANGGTLFLDGIDEIEL